MNEPIILGNLKLPLSHAIRSQGFLFVSGQASVDMDTGEIIPGTLEEEITRSFQNLRTVIESGGGHWEDIVRMNCYVRRASDLPEYNRLYREFLKEPYPARTTITNCLPETLLFEVDCIVSLRD
jgi:2-iminobutanoate/2-iminopropanoate deaminase